MMIRVMAATAAFSMLLGGCNPTTDTTTANVTTGTTTGTTTGKRWNSGRNYN